MQRAQERHAQMQETMQAALQPAIQSALQWRGSAGGGGSPPSYTNQILVDGYPILVDGYPIVVTD